MINKPPVADLTQLSAFLQVSGRALTYLAKFTGDNVNKHEIVTNNGAKHRTIYAPNEALKMVQSRFRERILLPIATPDYVHGFVPGKSSATNAGQHTDSGLVVNLDLKDFFPSISARRVHAFWKWVLSDVTDEAVKKRLAWVATSVTTFDGHLCQGFVTSPDIANRIAWKLDLRLAALAASKSLTYTRYADDLTFSARAYDGNCRWLIDAVSDIAADEGFKVNPKKIAVMRPHRRQVVTGLVINKVFDAETKAMVSAAPRIPRHELRRIRAMCDKGAAMKNPEDRAHVEGWLSYIHSVQPEKAAELRALLEARIANPKWPVPKKAVKRGHKA